MKAFRPYVLALIGSGSLVFSACQKSGESGSKASRKEVASESSPAAPGGAAAWKTEIKKVCDLPSFRPAALKQNLAIKDSIGGSNAYSSGRGQVKCVYASKGQVAIEMDMMAMSNLDGARRMFKDVPGTLKDYPGFGKEAFVFTVPLGAESFHSLVVLKDGVMIVLSAIAEVEALRKTATTLFLDLGISI